MSRKPEITYPLSNLPPISEASLADVKDVLAGLVPGVYLSSDLYARYKAVMAHQGRAPASPQAFGRMLSQYGGLRCKKRGKNAWRMDPD